jgi:hypothetical protein
MEPVGPQDEPRVDQIRRSFEEKGWRFFVEEERGSWVAWFFHEKVGPSTNDVTREPTALEAARAAWDKFMGGPRASAESPPRRTRQARTGLQTPQAYKAHRPAKARRPAR